jgi:hypothetical protein
MRFGIGQNTENLVRTASMRPNLMLEAKPDLGQYGRSRSRDLAEPRWLWAFIASRLRSPLEYCQISRERPNATICMGVKKQHHRALLEPWRP